MNPSESNLARLIDEGKSLQREGRLADAEEVFRRVLREDAASFEALYRIGSIRTEEGKYEEAVEYLRRALRQDPRSANAHYNLGIALSSLGRADEAMASYKAAIASNPGFVEAHANLGNLLDAARLSDDAIDSYRRALAIKPDMTEANHNLVRTLLRLGRRNEVVEVYRRWVELVPDDDEIRYLYALHSGTPVTARLPDSYVERGFDTLAPTFDEDSKELGYRTPRLILSSLERAVGPPRGRLEILDAGCGTGLCGPVVRPHALHLTGVDLSSGMLDRARKTGLYDALEKAELTGYLGSHADAFDLIVSADVLTYFGPLEQVLAAAHQALRQHSLFIFTVEKAFEHRARDGYRLNAHGRYSHSLTYLRRALRGAGFGALAIETSKLRTERGQPVAGFVVTCEKIARAGLRSRVRIRAHALRMWVRGVLGRHP